MYLIKVSNIIPLITKDFDSFSFVYSQFVSYILVKFLLLFSIFL